MIAARKITGMPFCDAACNPAVSDYFSQITLSPSMRMASFAALAHVRKRRTVAKLNRFHRRNGKCQLADPRFLPSRKTANRRTHTHADRRALDHAADAVFLRRAGRNRFAHGRFFVGLQKEAESGFRQPVQCPASIVYRVKPRVPLTRNRGQCSPRRWSRPFSLRSSRATLPCKHQRGAVSSAGKCPPPRGSFMPRYLTVARVIRMAGTHARRNVF